MIKLFWACLLAAPLAAQEYVVTDGPLPDGDFYNLVACGAAPGAACNMPYVAWRKPAVTVTFAPVPLAYPAVLAKEMSRVLDTTLAQINGSAPGLNVRRVSKSESADIVLYLQPLRAGDTIRGTGRPELDGIPIGAAQVQIWWDEALRITDAVIVFAADIPLGQVGPIMLEEVTQAMGLMTDIRNPYYDSLSVFSEDSNSVVKLGVQDRMALRRHYPAR
ncbi:MAG: DUF2927 domain-containing protein [Octadecabacter sp.]|nr:DUF2927 domain-containing protein [Octadecabacter sp.]